MKKFLRDACMTTHISHRGLAIGKFTFLLKVSCVLSLFAQ